MSTIIIVSLYIKRSSRDYFNKTYTLWHTTLRKFVSEKKAKNKTSDNQNKSATGNKISSAYTCMYPVD